MVNIHGMSLEELEAYFYARPMSPAELEVYTEKLLEHSDQLLDQITARSAERARREASASEKRVLTNRVVLDLRTKTSELNGERWVEGWATTRTADRVGDIIEPTGGKFSLPLPFLYQHKRGDPIGKVEHANTTERGIFIRARISNAPVPIIDHAWGLISAGLVPGLSIGFRGLQEPEVLPTGGLRYRSWELLEVSAVTIPANTDSSLVVAQRGIVRSHVPVILK
jgi:HK97 family phage prohead protease